MKTKKVLEVLFPQVRAEMLRLLFSSPSDRRHVRELMSKSLLALSTVQRELQRLRAVGLVLSSSDGYRHFYRPNREHPLFPALMQIVYFSHSLPTVKKSLLEKPGKVSIRKKRLRRLPPEHFPHWGIVSRKRR